MKKSDYEGLNVAQTFFAENRMKLLAPLNGRGAAIDLDELTQRIYVKLGKIDDPDFNNLQDPFAFTFKIIKRTAVDLYRETNRHEVGFTPTWHASDPGMNPERAIVAKVFIEQAWKRCSPEEKQLLSCIYERLSTEEIAEKLGISQASVRKRKERLFKKLRDNPP